MSDKRKDLLDLLCNLSDLSALVTGSENIENFLQRTVTMVAGHLGTPVCSIYLFDEQAGELVMNATFGLNPKAVGRVRMRPGQGLVGTVMENRQPILEGHASQNPDFKYFPVSDEDRFESFLAVPIQRGVVKIGVLVVQHEKPDYFKESDIIALKATGAQLAAAVENARLLMDLQQMCRITPNAVCDLGFITGEAASPGFAFAEALIWNKSHGLLVTDENIPESGTQTDFHKAVEKTQQELETLQQRCVEKLPESASLIFAAHFMILKDPKFVGRMKEKIDETVPASRAVREVAGHYGALFAASPHPYIREKVSDIEDLAGRLLKNLGAPGRKGDRGDTGGKIVVAKTLYPSELLKLAAESVKGVVLVEGGLTAHVAIISRSLKIPMAVVQCPELLHLPENTPVLLDGGTGNVYVDPSENILEQFTKINQAEVHIKKDSTLLLKGPTRTRDGHRVHLLANINLLSELPLAGDIGAEGIGLYRTEFPFLVRPSFPSETEQYMVYRKVIEAMGDNPVTFRTLDIGGDKTPAYSDTGKETNPELGLRAIRFTLEYRDVFEQQVRAILRAAKDSKSVEIMFPMISSMDEFLKARRIVYHCIENLKKENINHHSRPAIGMMVELPSVIEILEEFAGEVDFFALGTNDFIQYMLGVDRGNKQVAKYYRPEHPSVLRAIAKVAGAAGAHKKPLSICGEMGHDPMLIPFLLGIGIDRISTDPQYLPAVRRQISGLSLSDCRAHALELLSKGRLKDVGHVLDQVSF